MDGIPKNKIGTSKPVSAYHKIKIGINNVVDGIPKNKIGISKPVSAYHKIKRGINNVFDGIRKNKIGISKLVCACTQKRETHCERFWLTLAFC